MHVFYTTLVRARVSASEILSYITSVKFDSWKDTTESFILNWQDQVCLCESLVDNYSYFSENQKKILLQNSVDSVKSLRCVKDQANQLFTNTQVNYWITINMTRWWFPQQIIMINNFCLHPLEALETFTSPN